jgi:hypothetical protein
MLSQGRGDYGASYLLELHPALRLAPPLAAELAVSSWAFPGKQSTGRATLWGAGLRLERWLNPQLSLFVDGHLGLGVTGGNRRFMFDGGTGLEYAVGELLSLGLFARYGQVADSRTDPKFAAGGAFLALTWPEERLPPPPLQSPSPAEGAPGSGGPAGSGMADAAAPLARDGGVPDGKMADRDAAPDGVVSQ